MQERQLHPQCESTSIYGIISTDFIHSLNNGLVSIIALIIRVTLAFWCIHLWFSYISCSDAFRSLFTPSVPSNSGYVSILQCEKCKRLKIDMCVCIGLGSNLNIYSLDPNMRVFSIWYLFIVFICFALVITLNVLPERVGEDVFSTFHLRFSAFQRLLIQFNFLLNQNNNKWK